MNNIQKGNLYILLAAFLWSTGGLLLKYVSYNPLAINGLRCAFAFLIFCLYRKSPKIRFSALIVLAALALALTNILFVASNKHTTAANAIVLQYTAPIWVLIWNSIYKKRAPRLSELLTMILAFGGTLLFFLDGLTTEYIFGNLLALASGICFSGVLFLNFLPKASSEDSSMLAFIICFIVSIPFLKEVAESPSGTAILCIILIGVFQVGAAYICFSKGSKLTTPVTASLIGLLEAVMNPFWVFIFYGEKIGRFALLGAVLIIVAVAVQIITSSRAEKTS